MNMTTTSSTPTTTSTTSSTPTTTSSTARTPTTTSGTAGTSDRFDHRERIAAALGRLKTALAGKPQIGHSTSRSVVTLGNGVRCTSSERSVTLDFDLGSALGGDRSAATPGMHLRAALGACLAMGYQLRAAERDIALTAVRVTVEEHSELSGLLLTDSDVAPGPVALRYHVEIDSPSDPGDIELLIDAADRHSPVLDALNRPIATARTLTITEGAR